MRRARLKPILAHLCNVLNAILKSPPQHSTNPKKLSTTNPLPSELTAPMISSYTESEGKESTHPRRWNKLICVDFDALFDKLEDDAAGVQDIVVILAWLLRRIVLMRLRQRISTAKGSEGMAGASTRIRDPFVPFWGAVRILVIGCGDIVGKIGGLVGLLKGSMGL